MEILKDIWGFMKQRKKYWLLPLILTLLLFGIILAIGSNSVAAPFIYSIF